MSWSIEANEAVKEASAAIKQLQRDNASLRLQMVALDDERNHLSSLLARVEQEREDEAATLHDALARHMDVAAERDAALDQLQALEAAIQSMHVLLGRSGAKLHPFPPAQRPRAMRRDDHMEPHVGAPKPAQNGGVWSRFRRSA